MNVGLMRMLTIQGVNLKNTSNQASEGGGFSELLFQTIQPETVDKQLPFLKEGSVSGISQEEKNLNALLENLNESTRKELGAVLRLVLSKIEGLDLGSEPSHLIDVLKEVLEEPQSEDAIPDFLAGIDINVLFPEEIEQGIKNKEDMTEIETVLVSLIAVLNPYTSIEKEEKQTNSFNRDLTQSQIQTRQVVTSLNNLSKQKVTTEPSMTTKNTQKILSSILQRLTTGDQASEIKGKQITTQLLGSDSSLQMTRVQQYVIHVGESQPKEVQQEQFIRQFQEMLGRSNLQTLKQGLQQLSVKLHPEHLGRLDIRLTSLEGVITAKIMTSSTMAKELIESQLHQLRNVFTNQQINVEKIEVNQQQSFFDQSNKEEEKSKREDKEQQQSDSEDFEQEQSFYELLEEVEDHGELTNEAI